MSYWSEVKEVVLKGVDLAIANLKETTELAIGKGKEGVTYVQMKKDLFKAHRELQNFLSDFGDMVNEIYKVKGDIYSDDKVKEAAEKVAAAEAKCKDIENRKSENSKRAAS